MFKPYQILIILSLVFVAAACKNIIRPTVDDRICSPPPGKVLDTENAVDLTAKLFMVPSPDLRAFNIEDGFRMGLCLENRGKEEITGSIEFSDELGCVTYNCLDQTIPSFFIPGLEEDQIKPNFEDVRTGKIFYTNENKPDGTIYHAEISYLKREEFTSEQFCLKQRYNQVVSVSNKPCGVDGSVRVPNSELIGSIRYTLTDLDGDPESLIDRLDLEFDLNERCNIVEEQEFIGEMVIDVSVAGSQLDCELDQSKDKKRKTIKCELPGYLSMTEYLEDRIEGSLDYGCTLKLESDYINFKRDE